MQVGTVYRSEGYSLPLKAPKHEVTALALDRAMFSSDRGGDFGGFGAQGSNPFQTQGPAAGNPFQSGTPAAKTAFGRSSDFGRHPPLPPGGLADAPPLPGSRFGSQPPLPPGGLAGAPPTPSGGFGAASSSGNPFGRKKNNKNKPQSSFGQNGVSPSATTGAHTTFGSASAAGGNPKNRGKGFAGNAPPTAFRGGGSSSFGGNVSGFGGVQTAFGAPTTKRGQGSFSKDSGGFGSSSGAAPAPLSSPGTSFGSQASGVNVRRKQLTPNGSASARAAAQTTFGGPSSGNAFQSASVGKPSPAGGSGVSAAFGEATDKRRQTRPTFGSEASAGGFPSTDNLVSMEARMGGVKKSPSGQGKRAQGFGAPASQEADSFGGQQRSMSRSSSGRFPPDGAAFGNAAAPKRSPTSEKHSKHRQTRAKTKAPSASDDETPFAHVPSGGSSSVDDNSKAQLSAATNLDGTCADMCSAAERELHIRVDELSVFEKCFPDRPGSERDMIIKRFQRSSADHKLDIPGEIRPPGVLRRTQLYIEQQIMDLDQCGLDPRFQTPRVPEPIELYNFCWDRFRMIRKDFVLQNYRGAGGRVHPIALDIHERIARYHVLSEHELIETESFVAQQNMEQLGQTLKSLNELYDESHKAGDPARLSPFEAECRAYFILCTLDNGRGMDVLKYVKVLPHHILESPHIKFAMRVFVARHTGDYFQFFSLLRQATYLQSCLLFRYIPNVRSSALLRMNRAYRRQTYPLEDLVELLCFDDIEHAYSVCQEHKLRISGRPGAGDDSNLLVKFGGDFETDAQLRRSNTPLKIRSSKIYVGMKQGNYLRRDICRGVTEYARDGYPALSKLIQDLEREERARLYPNRPEYQDDYSYFVDYNDGAPMAPRASASSSASFGTVQHQPADPDQKRHDLDLIAQRKEELEQKKQLMLQRMRELEQAKEEKARKEEAKKTVYEQAAQREEQTKKEAAARAQAEQEAAEAERQQQELEEQLREQKKRRELEEQRKRAEDAAREAERQRLVALQQAEALRKQAAEEERRRQEEHRQAEIRRQEAEERERRRQQEVAEARARQAREAAVEAARQAQLAKEREEQKRIRRAEKQRLAVLKLKLHLWKKYVRVSRHGSGPVAIDAAKLRLDRPLQMARESVRWLFNGADGTAGVPIGTKRLKQPSKLEGDALSSGAESSSFWSAEDMLGLVGASLRRINPGTPSIAWKLVIADLLNGPSSSFGLWCAVKAGTQDASVPEHDCHCIFQSTSGMTQGVAVCCRYLDSTFAQRSSRDVQQAKLAATSAIILPVDLRSLRVAGDCSGWEHRLDELLSSLNAECRVAVVALAFASSEIESSQALFMSSLESCIGRMKTRFPSQVTHASVEFIGAEDLHQKFGETVSKVAALSTPVRHLMSVGLKELLEGSVKAIVNQHESSVGLQGNICAVFPRVREDILSSGVMDLAYPPPELQFAIMDPPPGWNSQDKQHEIRTVLTALEVTRIAADPFGAAVSRDQVCDVYFNRIVDFIDRLFGSYAVSTAASTYELKKRIYSSLLPVHEGLTQKPEEDDVGDQVTPQEADALLPWRKIFEEIYDTFFEALSDITIYYPADWRGFDSSVSRLLAASSAPQQLIKSQSSKRDRVASKQQPVQVSIQSVRRSFGAVDESLQEYRAVGEMKRLRVEIEKERAATSQFQRMLRQALNRWDD